MTGQELGSIRRRLRLTLRELSGAVSLSGSYTYDIICRSETPLPPGRVDAILKALEKLGQERADEVREAQADIAVAIRQRQLLKEGKR